MISIPPFRITGRIHLLPERDLHEALSELTGRFIPVTEATYWSDTVGEARATAPLLAFNHSRAQILAPHREVDPWAGLDRSAAAGGTIATSRRRPPAPGAGPWATCPRAPDRHPAAAGADPGGIRSRRRCRQRDVRRHSRAGRRAAPHERARERDGPQRRIA